MGHLPKTCSPSCTTRYMTVYVIHRGEKTIEVVRKVASDVCAWFTLIQIYPYSDNSLTKIQTALLTKVISKGLLHLHGIYVTAIIKTIFIMGVHGSRKGYGDPKRISFLAGFSFPLRLGHLCPTRPISSQFGH